jgi:hypothetical protein
LKYLVRSVFLKYHLKNLCALGVFAVKNPFFQGSLTINLRPFMGSVSAQNRGFAETADQMLKNPRRILIRGSPVQPTVWLTTADLRNNADEIRTNPRLLSIRGSPVQPAHGMVKNQRNYSAAGSKTLKV